jgi:hypothetical protein
VLIVTAISLTGCDRPDNSLAAAGFQVTLIPDAVYPGSFMTVEISDADDEPVTDVTVSLEGNMTHAGMAPVLTESVWDGADGVEDGRYRVPFAFTMLGDWIITVKIEQREGDPLSEDIDLIVTSGGVSIVDE